MGRRLGEADDPLLVCVRSGAKFSMPGMMETVLNIGLNDESVLGLAAAGGDERFAWDSYRRLIQMFGKTVLGIDGERLRARARRGQEGRGHRDDLDSTPPTSRRWSTSSRSHRAEHAGRDFPQDPREQLDLAVRAVFDSWNTERAVLYRRQERIPDDLGTAVNVCSMVFGNLRRRLRHRRRLHPRPGLRRTRACTATTCRTRRARTSSRASATPCRSPTWSSSTRRRYDELLGDHGDAREPLPGPVRHRVHHRARQAVDAADPGRQADRRGGVPDRRAAGRPGPDRPGRGARRGSPARSSRS